MIPAMWRHHSPSAAEVVTFVNRTFKRGGAQERVPQGRIKGLYTSGVRILRRESRTRVNGGASIGENFVVSRQQTQPFLPRLNNQQPVERIAMQGLQCFDAGSVTGADRKSH